MPILLQNINLEYKLLPITLNEDGTTKIVIRKGYTLNGIFNIIEGITIELSAVITASVLDTTPTPGLSRRDDLSLAIYTYLVTNNLIEQGVIS